MLLKNSDIFPLILPNVFSPSGQPANIHKSCQPIKQTSRYHRVPEIHQLALPRRRTGAEVRRVRGELPPRYRKSSLPLCSAKPRRHATVARPNAAFCLLVFCSTPVQQRALGYICKTSASRRFFAGCSSLGARSARTTWCDSDV